MDWLMKELKNDVSEALKTIKITDIDDSMYEAINEVVYDPYAPTKKAPYTRRREAGGLSDKRNFKMNFVPSSENNSVEVVIRNMTTGNKDYYGSVYHWNKSYTFEIDRIIVEGIGYSWKNSRFYHLKIERDFYKATLEKVEAYLYKRIKEELEAKGW